jgi:hypothetical protein
MHRVDVLKDAGLLFKGFRGFCRVRTAPQSAVRADGYSNYQTRQEAPGGSLRPRLGSSSGFMHAETYFIAMP